MRSTGSNRRTPHRGGIYLLILAGLISGLLISGCAYFNSFYNTKRSFREAERERLRTTEMDAKPAGYTKAIDSGGRLLEYFPKSRYVLNTLLIMGQSYYWTEEYHKAKRKFEEILSNYPDAPECEEARLWLGRSYVGMKNRQQATSILRGLLADTDDPKLTSGALFALAELYILDSLFLKAEEEFLNVTSISSDPEILGEAYWRAGESAFGEKRFPEAIDNLQNALQHKLPRTMRFRTSLFLARAYYESSRYPEAIALFRKLLKDKRYFEEHGKVRVHLALAEAALGNTENTLEELQKVIDNHPRSPESSRAYYERALMNLERNDRDQSKLDLDAARVEKAGSEYAQRADTLLNALNRVDQLSGQRSKTLIRIDLTDKWVADPIRPDDTTSFREASFYDSLAIDSLRLAALWNRAWRDSIPALPDPEPDSQAPDSLAPGDTSGAEVIDSLTHDVLETFDILADSSLFIEEINETGLMPAPPMADTLDVADEPEHRDNEAFLEALGMASDSLRAVGVIGMGMQPEPVPQAATEVDTVDEEEFSLTGEIEPADSMVVADSLTGEADTMTFVLPDSVIIFDDSLAAIGVDTLDTDSSMVQEDTVEDSLETVVETAPEPPPQPEPITIFDPSVVHDSLAFMKASLQDIRFQLAEILLLDLDQPDSARTVFQELANPPNVDSVRARATFALAYIALVDSQNQLADSIMELVADDFAGLKIGIEAALRLGRELQETPIQPDEEAFLKAETSFLADSSRSEEAYGLYRWMVETYPNSAVAPSAMFASAYIAGNLLGDNETAEDLLISLQENYPSSEQAIEAGRMLSALQEARSREARGDSADFIPTEEELSAHPEEELDVKPELIGGQETLANILEMRNLLPQEVISGTGGEVLLRYIVYSDGTASNFRILLENPPGRGFAGALISALGEVSFRPGIKEGEDVDTRIERRYTLPLDAPPNVRPLPRRFRS